MVSEAGHSYCAIDLKSYYASAECVDRNLDPLDTNLVVADSSRTEKTICLAVSPSLKAYGISGRARLFEVVQRVKAINRERFQNALRRGLLPKDENGKPHFASSSFSASALAADPALELTFIIAPPRMKLYETLSTKIISIYTKYVSPEDICVYSIDECFLDLTKYLKVSQRSAYDFTITMIRDVLHKTGITATAGIGTNLYLAKIAMDIVAKHIKADKDGVRIAELTEQGYREQLWCHKPLTDFWRVGPGIAKRLESLGCETMGDIARLSVRNERILYSALGINAELVIDHAWGWEPTEMKTIKSYQPETNSITSGQVLMEPYNVEKGRLIVREMTELLALDLVRKGVVTKKIMLTIGYDRESINCQCAGRGLKDSIFVVASTGEKYEGVVTKDHYGRPVPRYAHGTGNISRWTNSTRRIMEVMLELYDKIVDPTLLIRRVTIVAANLIREQEVPVEQENMQMSLFVDYDAQQKEKAAEAAADDKERKIQKVTLALQKKYGKNAILKGMNLSEGATTKLRNAQIGGHKA